MEKPSAPDPVRLFFHELKTPLATLVGYLDLLDRHHPGVEDRKEETLTILKRNARRLHLLITLLEEWLMLERGVSEPLASKTPIYLEEMEKEADSLFEIAQKVKTIAHHPHQEKILFVLRLVKALDDKRLGLDLRVKRGEVELALPGKIVASHLLFVTEVARTLGAKIPAPSEKEDLTVVFSLPEDPP
jgi:signal transduction histidine kinase